MTDVQAAIGLAQSRRYDGLLARRREIISMYKNGLKGDVEVLEHFGDDFTSSGHLMLIRIPVSYTHLKWFIHLLIHLQHLC